MSHKCMCIYLKQWFLYTWTSTWTIMNTCGYSFKMCCMCCELMDYSLMFIIVYSKTSGFKVYGNLPFHLQWKKPNVFREVLNRKKDVYITIINLFFFVPMNFYKWKKEHVSIEIPFHIFTFYHNCEDMCVFAK